MQITMIEPEAWQQVRDQYPSAIRILERSALRGEFKQLSLELAAKRGDYRRHRWITERLKSLQDADLECLRDLY